MAECGENKVPYEKAEMYGMLSLDAKARLAARRYVRENGRPPKSYDITAALVAIDPEDRLNRTAAWHAAKDAERLFEIMGLQAFL